jgi:hypothetical protein
LFTHHWRVLLAAAVGLSAAAAFAEDLSATRIAAVAPAADDALAPFRQGTLIDTFGRWQVRKGLVDNTYLLIGESSGSGEGHFWLHCDQNRLMTVAVPLAEHNGQEHLRSHAIRIRADTGAAREMDLVVFESFVAVAMDFEGGRNDKVADFVDVLRSAKQTVTISYAHKNFEYDVSQLPAAQARFLQLCGRSAALAPSLPSKR